MGDGRWVELDEDADCACCHYTIRKDDPEGMFLVDGRYFCMEACYKEWLAESS